MLFKKNFWGWSLFKKNPMKFSSVRKKVCENVKGVIDTKYIDFDVEYEMVWYTNLGPKATRSRSITSFYEYFEEPLDHVNFHLNLFKIILKI